jgi:putative ABC transport system permease protein
MALPVKYNLRNLRIRWRSTLATVVGVALVVAVFVMVTALAQGLNATYISTGDVRNLLVLRKGSTSETSSQVGRDQVRQIRYLDEIERNEAGQPLASAEIIVLSNLERVQGKGTANVLVRGLGPVGLELRPNVRIIEGRMFRPGLHECVVSKKISERFEGCRIGQTFRTGKYDWNVVGIFDASRTAYDSEIWVDADEARDAFNRSFYGSVLLRPRNEQAATNLVQRLEADKQLHVRVLPETEYYSEQTQTAAPIQFMGRFLAIIMSIGAAFSAMNTMYAAVGARTREIGTLRVLGFKRREIYISFMIESICLGLVGGALGCLFSLPLNGWATGTFSWTTFSEVAFEFRITPSLLAKGMGFAVLMGILGGLLPAKMAAQKPVLDALRAT